MSERSNYSRVIKTGSENGSTGSKRLNWVKKTVKNDVSFRIKKSCHSAFKMTRCFSWKLTVAYNQEMTCHLLVSSAIFPVWKQHVVYSKWYVIFIPQKLKKKKKKKSFFPIFLKCEHTLKYFPKRKDTHLFSIQKFMQVLNFHALTYRTFCCKIYYVWKML